MVIKRYKNNVNVSKVNRVKDNVENNNRHGGDSMENVLVLDKYIERTKDDECDWDVIRNICQKAIKRNGFTKEQVQENSKRLLREVRTEK